MKLIGITGWKDMGKTTLTERLVAHYTVDGLRVSTLKHTHHGVDLDREGTDSYRHRAAGAVQTVLASRARVAVLTELRDDPEWEIADILRNIAPCDLVLVEGFKKSPHPKLEVYRAAVARGRPPVAADNPGVKALVGDMGEVATELPVFASDDLAAIAAIGLSVAEEVAP